MNDTRTVFQSIMIYVGAFLILIWSAGPFLWQFSTSSSSTKR
ncbi:hypothetical protein FHT86_003090 [Rhizobium sp. BK313]|nr:hypothetical protein [Rhizobium sp. BK313]MBB3454791.1 hypothetical protein [Rhizobium sp. BK313]